MGIRRQLEWFHGVTNINCHGLRRLPWTHSCRGDAPKIPETLNWTVRFWLEPELQNVPKLVNWLKYICYHCMVNGSYIKQSWTKWIPWRIKIYDIFYFHLTIGFCVLFWFTWITWVKMEKEAKNLCLHYHLKQLNLRFFQSLIWHEDSGHGAKGLQYLLEIQQKKEKYLKCTKLQEI